MPPLLRLSVAGWRRADLADEMVPLRQARAVRHGVADEHQVDRLLPQPLGVVEPMLVGHVLGERSRPLPAHDGRQIGHARQRQHARAIGKRQRSVAFQEIGRRVLDCRRHACSPLGFDEAPELLDVQHSVDGIDLAQLEEIDPGQDREERRPARRWRERAGTTPQSPRTQTARPRTAATAPGEIGFAPHGGDKHRATRHCDRREDDLVGCPECERRRRHSLKSSIC